MRIRSFSIIAGVVALAVAVPGTSIARQPAQHAPQAKRVPHAKRGVTRAASSVTYCGSLGGLPTCYQFTGVTWGPAWYQAPGWDRAYYIRGRQVTLGGNRTDWWWDYSTGSQWVRYHCVYCVS